MKINEPQLNLIKVDAHYITFGCMQILLSQIGAKVVLPMSQ